MYLKGGVKQIIFQFLCNSKNPDIHKAMLSFQSYRRFGKDSWQLLFSDTAHECASISNKTLSEKQFKDVRKTDAMDSVFYIAGLSGLHIYM